MVVEMVHLVQVDLQEVRQLLILEVEEVLVLVDVLLEQEVQAL